MRIGISSNESTALRWFKNAAMKTKNVSELKEIVSQALHAGIRLNACHEGEGSFADFVVLKMLSCPPEGDKKKDIMRELMLNEAAFSYDLVQDKRINKDYNELYQEVKPQIDKRLKELKEAGENAVQGGIVEDVCIDNKTFYMKFSKDSTLKPVEVLEGARRLGLNKGCVELGGNIIKIGDSEIEVSEKGGKRNYTDLSGDAVMLYQFSLLVIQIGYIAELFNCGVGKRSNKFTQSTLKQSNSIVYFIAQNVLFYIQPKPLNWIEFR